MALTDDERGRLLTSLRSDESFREEVRRELLSAELLELPARLAALVEQMHAFVEQMHAFVEATNRRLGRLEDDSAKLRGMILEAEIARNPGY